MRRITLIWKNTYVVALTLALLVVAVAPVHAQNQATSGTVAVSMTNQVPTGTRFLAGLDEVLSTEGSKAGDRFTARTLEPLVAADGTVLPPGAKIRGHVDKVEEAHATGRGKLWLTFDDIQEPDAVAPIVAVVTDVPGVHSVRVDYAKESEIEVRTGNKQEQAEAAAEAALVGAEPGVATKDKKAAAIGAAAGAATAFMAASGLGQELTLGKGTKLELELERPLYFFYRQ